MDFTKQFNDLINAAYHYITDTVKKQKAITFFDETPGKTHVWNQDVYEDVPDFAYYDGVDSAEWAAIKEIRHSETAPSKLRAY